MVRGGVVIVGGRDTFQFVESVFPLKGFITRSSGLPCSVSWSTTFLILRSVIVLKRQFVQRKVRIIRRRRRDRMRTTMTCSWFPIPERSIRSGVIITMRCNPNILFFPRIKFATTLEQLCSFFRIRKHRSKNRNLGSKRSSVDSPNKRDEWSRGRFGWFRGDFGNGSIPCTKSSQSFMSFWPSQYAQHSMRPFVFGFVV